MRDENNSFAGIAKRPERCKEMLYFRWSKHCRRLVKNHDGCITEEQFEDFNPLLFSDTETFRHSLRIYGKPEFEGMAVYEYFNFFQGKALKEACVFVAEHDIFSYRQGRYKHKMLMNHPDTCIDSFAGGGEFDRFSLYAELSFGGLQHAVYDFGQGAFACTVFTDERVNGALLD